MSDSTELFGPEQETAAQEMIARYPQARSALIPMLHYVQSIEGYVSQAGVAFCARQLGLSTAEVDAVVTFYTMYKRRPCGEHLISVCTNALCALLGGDAIYTQLREHLGGDGPAPREEETFGEPGTPGSLSLERVECLASCDLAPVVQVDYEYFDKQTPVSAIQLADALRHGEKPAPSRGAPLINFRAVERQLAGFLDGEEFHLEDTVDGPSTSVETVQGAVLARDRGWTAPIMPEEAPLPEVEEKR